MNDDFIAPEFDSFGWCAGLKTNGLTGASLGEAGQVGGNHVTKARVASGGLCVRKQDDG